VLPSKTQLAAAWPASRPSFSAAATIAVTVDNGAVQRHVLIVGGIGSGKSYTRGVLGEELRRWGVPQVNIDVNGEMIDAARQLGGVNVRPATGSHCRWAR
jgi:DNA helicase HerA-like ATPase